MGRLSGRIALVTGASDTKEIGSAICLQFAKEGADIFFTHFRSQPDWDRSFTDEIQHAGVRCKGMEIDLSDSSSPINLLDAVHDTLGFPTILVNNAAHSASDGYMKLDAGILDSHYTVNVRATCLLSVEFARRFKQFNQRNGRIINMTSGQALGPMHGELAYAASKGAISAFTLSLSTELAPLGITVNAVNPGPTDSGWMTEDVKQYLLPKFSKGRIGIPEDAARLVTFLASDEAEWITGQVINSEGGYRRN